MNNNLFKIFLRKIISIFCVCGRCPSYPKTKDLKTYCEFGKSIFDVNGKGCICFKCFVWKINRFKNYYYCEKGKDPKSKI
jgi:hypothetical protein